MEIDFDKYKELQFCDNKECSYYEQIGERNIKIHSRQQRQVYCNSCQQIWVITKNTFFYSLKTSPKKVVHVLCLLAEGLGLRATARTEGVTTDIIQDWVLKAAEHVNEVSALLQSQMKLNQCQIDEFWSFIRKKKGNYLKKKSF